MNRMIDVDSVNLIIGIVGLMLCILGFIQILSSRLMERKTKKYFIVFFMILTAYVCCVLFNQVTLCYTGKIWALCLKIGVFFESFFSSMLMPFLTVFLLYSSGDEQYRKNPVYDVSVLLWVIYFALLVYTQFSTGIYYVSDDNVYHRGPWYPVLLIPPLLLMAWNLIILLKKRKLLSERQRIAFQIYLLLPTACILIQMVLYGVLMIVLGTVISSFFMLTYIIMDQTEQYYKKEAENEKLKIDILLAQIQPHFLFNSLTTIKYICREDAQKAEYAITEFTKYLRHNMDSLAIDYPIAFEDELKHVKSYLALQKIRFEDELDVTSELECTDFLIPTLTMQPLVENAVSYGVRRSEDGTGVVTIRSKRYPDHVEVSVADDGPGFVYENVLKDKERSHNGIRNVSERLKRVCGGELRVESVVGKGTTMTILLPQKEENIC